MSSTDGIKTCKRFVPRRCCCRFNHRIAQFSKMIFKSPTPKLEPNVRDAGMVAADIAVAMATKDFLVAQNILPANILE